MKSYPDKQDSWLIDFVPELFCFQCGEFMQTFDHLMFQGHVKMDIRNLLLLFFCNFQFNKKPSLIANFLTPKIGSSWTEEPIKFHFFQTKQIKTK